MDAEVFYDTHAHLDFPEFAADLGQVIERARASGIRRILTIGIDLESSARAIQLAETHADVYAVVGWHPGHVSEAPADIRVPLRELARHPRVVALGETGLDFHRLPSRQPRGSAADDEGYRQRQEALFRQHLEVAAETGLGCVVHQRDALDATLRTWGPLAASARAVFHCFAGGVEDAKRVLDLGGCVSFTGILTFKNAANVRAALAAVPMDRFMLETDCPFLAPAPHRGKRCEPAYVRLIAECAADVKGCSLAELSASTCATAEHFFRFP
jgi:TatD DNase family protein